MKVLALSSSRVGNGGYLAAALPLINDFLGDARLNVAFVPFASAEGTYEEYADQVGEALAGLPLSVRLVKPTNAVQVLNGADVIMIGGGNTFKLLHDIYSLHLFQLIKQKVEGGTPYIGWSAGANLTGRTIGTTNDMPIVQPESFLAFNFLPFQINPHYQQVVMEGFHGETRDQRLMEYCLLNPGIPVVALPEGTALRMHHQQLYYLGNGPAFLFQRLPEEKAPTKKSVVPGTDLSFLLNP